MEQTTNMQGLCHVYWGDGKGKTTAAMGLALRALGAGKRVTVVQFLKDGSSAELQPLRRLGACVLSGRAGEKFTWQMTEQQAQKAREEQKKLLCAARKAPCDMLILDEACTACELGFLEEEALRRAVAERPAGTELVLTGHRPAEWILQQADYSTEMRCHKHPYSRGIPARKGVEF